jgi:UDP-glucuronate 4-epimerase
MYILNYYATKIEDGRVILNTNTMKILVTGGAGFIGSSLVKRLVSEDHEVVVIDNFNEYYDVSLKRAREQELLVGATVLEGDFTDEAFLENVFSTYQFDVVCHLGAQAGVRYSVEYPEVYVHTNVRGTQLLLETMQKFGVKRIVYASTSSAYGDTSEVPFVEHAAADRPISVYAATKRAGEMLIHAYSSLYGIQATCLRFFTVYGPWGRPDMALFKFSKLMLEGKPIDVYNNGDMRRDFTYVDDVVEGFVRAIERPFSYEVINLGNSSPVALEAFITVLENEWGVEAQKNMMSMQSGDVHTTYADITKARTLLGYEPKTSVEEGVKNFVAWYKKFYS